MGAQYPVWRLADGRNLLPARRSATDRDPDARCAVHRHRQPAEPHLRRAPRQSDDRSLVRYQLFRSGAPDITGTYGDAGRGIIRGPGSFNIDASLVKNTRIGRIQTEIRIEAFNLLNHPQFANPNTTIGNSQVGTISAMLSSPNCSLCGTIERQVQLGVKVKF